MNLLTIGPTSMMNKGRRLFNKVLRLRVMSKARMGLNVAKIVGLEISVSSLP
jgi:D-Tyr-tRNAtyr deacylase